MIRAEQPKTERVGGADGEWLGAVDGATVGVKLGLPGTADVVVVVVVEVVVVEVTGELLGLPVG